MFDYEMSAEFIEENDPMVVLSLHNKIVAALNEDLNAAYAAQSEMQAQHAATERDLKGQIEQATGQLKELIDLYTKQAQKLSDATDALAWVMIEAMKEDKK